MSRHAIAFAKGQQRLFAKLKATDLSTLLAISDYTKRYLTDQLQSKSNLGLMRMVELGGGSGLQTLLAIESG